MTTAEKNTAIRNAALSLLGTMPEGTVEVKPGFLYAIPVEVDGEQRWATIEVKAKNNKATKTADAFDPFALQAEYAAEAEVKAKAKAEKAEAKAKKAEADKARRASKAQ